jgi:formate hydrogenlyase transcriptional activator
VIPDETLDALRRHPWPGNVRELENVIQRAVILSTSRRLTLPPIFVEAATQSLPKEPDRLKDNERAFIARVLEESNWVIGGPRGAAVRLGLKRTTLHSLMKRLGLSRPRDVAGAEFDAPRSYHRPGRMYDENWAVG